MFRPCIQINRPDPLLLLPENHAHPPAPMGKTKTPATTSHTILDDCRVFSAGGYVLFAAKAYINVQVSYKMVNCGKCGRKNVKLTTGRKDICTQKRENKQNISNDSSHVTWHANQNDGITDVCIAILEGVKFVVQRIARRERA